MQELDVPRCLLQDRSRIGLQQQQPEAKVIAALARRNPTCADDKDRRNTAKTSKILVPFQTVTLAAGAPRLSRRSCPSFPARSQQENFIQTAMGAPMYERCDTNIIQCEPLVIRARFLGWYSSASSRTCFRTPLGWRRLRRRLCH